MSASWASMLDAWPNVRVLLIGDFLLDRWVYGTIDRISREAPVFIVEHEEETWGLGGAANAAAQFRAYGADVWALGWLGEDAAGERLLHMLQERGIRTDAMIWLSHQPTVIKTRIIAGPRYALKQQVLRLDQGRSAETRSDYVERMVSSVHRWIDVADIVVVSDYGYGAGHAAVVSSTIAVARNSGKPVIGDSHRRLRNFRHATAVTPNEEELCWATGETWQDTEGLHPVVRNFCESMEIDAVLVTRGSRGMVLYERATAHWSVIPAFGSPAPLDVTGAGDTVVATFSLAYVTTRDFRKAAHAANVAGGLVVMKPGVAQVMRDELRRALEDHPC